MADHAPLCPPLLQGTCEDSWMPKWLGPWSARLSQCYLSHEIIVLETDAFSPTTIKKSISIKYLGWPYIKGVLFCRAFLIPLLPLPPKTGSCRLFSCELFWLQNVVLPSSVNIVFFFLLIWIVFNITLFTFPQKIFHFVKMFHNLVTLLTVACSLSTAFSAPIQRREVPQGNWFSRGSSATVITNVFNL